MESLPPGKSGRTARAVAVSAARSAGAIIRNQFGRSKVVGQKGRGNFVTQTDLLAEKTILEELRHEFPDHGIISEESPAVSADAHYVWIIDPLDGTTNFATGLPIFAVSIALVVDGQPALGVVYDPTHRDLFVAEKGRGCTLRGRRVTLGDKTDLGRAVGGFDLGYDEEARGRAMAVATAVRPRIQTLRLIGSAVLGQAYVACGRFDLYFHHYLYPWDLAAGQLLLREAGALVTEWAGTPAGVHSRTLVAANPRLHGVFLKAVEAL